MKIDQQQSIKAMQKSKRKVKPQYYFVISTAQYKQWEKRVVYQGRQIIC
jgi:hypothetical protein